MEAHETLPYFTALQQQHSDTLLLYFLNIALLPGVPSEPITSRQNDLTSNMESQVQEEMSTEQERKHCLQIEKKSHTMSVLYGCLKAENPPSGEIAVPV